MSKPPVIVFPHIPKTGGTTLLYHFRQNFGDAAIFIYGPHARARRFFQGLPQPEDMETFDWSQMRVIQGHGVDLGVLGMLPKGNARFLVVLRHPVGLTRSRFAHKAQILASRGIELTSEQFMRAEQGNGQCRMLIQKFGALVDDPTASLSEQAFSVLRHFHYVYTTENLDAQAVPMLQWLGANTRMERRRVSRKDRSVLEQGDDSLLAMNGEDLKLFERCNEVQDTDGTWHNPSLSSAADLRSIPQDLGVRLNQRQGYKKLAEALSIELAVETALEWIVQRPDLKPPAIQNLPLLREILEQTAAQEAPHLSDEAKAFSTRTLEKWRKRQAKLATKR